MIIEAAAAGASIGLGVWLVARGASPPPPPLAVALSNLHRPRWADDRPPVPTSPLARVVARIAAGTGQTDGTAARLALVGRTAERHALDRLIYTTLGAAVPLLTLAVATAGGATLPLLPVLIGVAVLGVVGFTYPEAALRTEATRTRRDLTAQLALYLDLVVVLLAGGRGVDGALTAAAQQSDGVAFTHIRRALNAARTHRESPWRALDRLGNELELTPLVELAASITLAGESGAKVRDSIAAKAQAIRSRLLAEAEAEAHRRSEVMSAPVVMMLAGFMAMVGFPSTYVLLTF